MIGYHGKGGNRRPGVDHTDLGLKYKGLLCVCVLVGMCVCFVKRFSLGFKLVS